MKHFTLSVLTAAALALGAALPSQAVEVNASRSVRSTRAPVRSETYTQG